MLDLHYSECLLSLKCRMSFTVEFLLYKFQTWQIHTWNKSETITKHLLASRWPSPGDSLQHKWGLSQQAFFWRDEQIHWTSSQLSSVSGHAAWIAFLSGFQFGFSDKCRGQAALGLWLQASSWARAVASHLGCSRVDCRHCHRNGTERVLQVPV